MKDSWVELNGIPALEHAQRLLDFVFGCLNEDDRCQEHAKQDLMQARMRLNESLEHLRSK